MANWYYSEIYSDFLLFQTNSFTFDHFAGKMVKFTQRRQFVSAKQIEEPKRFDTENNFFGGNF